MAMGRKRYTETAKIISNTLEDAKSVEGAARMIAQRLADMFKADNRAFDKAKFLDACGVGDPNGN